MRSEGILTWANSLLLIGFLVLSLLVTFSGTSLYARAQETFPDNIFASTSQTQLHELVLKAIQENGRTNTVSGFNVDLTNVITVPSGSELAIFTTDSALSINEAKLKTTTDAFIDLAKRSQSSFSLAGHPSGVYTIDVIAQKGTASAAYEGILVLGQEPTDPQTRTIIERQITKEDEDNDDDNRRNCDPSYPGVCIPPYPPDLDCPEIPYKNFRVTGTDPHRFDGDNDGIGCDSNEPKPPPDPCLNNPNLLRCIDPCEENPDLPECIDPCEENPDLPECIDPCEENPELEGCQEPLPPEDPCEENPSLPECEEEEAFVVDEEEGVEDEDDGNGDEGNEDSDSEDGNDEVESGGEDDEGGTEEEEGE